MSNERRHFQGWKGPCLRSNLPSSFYRSIVGGQRSQSLTLAGQRLIWSLPALSPPVAPDLRPSTGVSIACPGSTLICLCISFCFSGERAMVLGASATLLGCINWDQLALLIEGPGTSGDGLLFENVSSRPTIILWRTMSSPALPSPMSQRVSCSSLGSPAAFPSYSCDCSGPELYPNPSLPHPNSKAFWRSFCFLPMANSLLRRLSFYPLKQQWTIKQ